MSTPSLWYSVKTWLANVVSKNYYRDEHWVWCSPHFGSGVNPPSSTPGDIYRDLREATSRGDRHNSKIIANKAGILRGAVHKRDAGMIGEDGLGDINSMIETAETIDFRPLLYVIPAGAEVLALMKEVPVRDRAHPLSSEYIIEVLPKRLFDIIEP